MTPIRKSVQEFLHEYEKFPLYVHLSLDERIAFHRFIYKMAETVFNGKHRQLISSVRQTLTEHNFDIHEELFRAVQKSSDEEACEQIRECNLDLREHIENYPMNYNNPIRLLGQGGKLRMPMNIPPVDIRWPN
jgi:hypothetical protein